MRYVDLFCGAGGVGVGFREWECVAAVDKDAAASQVYTCNFPSHPFYGLDLAAPLPERLVEAWKGADVVIGGPPCQDYSSARRTQRRARADLTSSFARIATSLRPRFIVFENVSRAMHSAEFREMLSHLQSEGYHVLYTVVSALDIGMAQRRRRVVLFANQNEAALRDAWSRFTCHFSHPPATISTMRACFLASGLPFADHVFFPACNQKARQSVFSVDGPSPTIRSIVRPLREKYPFNCKDSTQDRGAVFPSLTVRHHAALQGFPLSFEWPGTRTDCARCVGNAVPPPIAEKIAEAISASISGSCPSCPQAPAPCS